MSAHYSDEHNIWTITTSNGESSTCRYFLAATGPLSLPRDPPFAGLKSYKGKWYQAATWPKETVNLRGKRIAVVGTGATGVQIIPKLAVIAKELTVYQRTPNYVLPGRNYTIDENDAESIRTNYDDTWTRASAHTFGLAMDATGYTVKGTQDNDKIRQILDSGWECGGFHFQFETFDDIFTDQQSNDVVSDYLRNKIHAIVGDQKKADLLTPTYPFLSKRPPCGHFYYETYNRPNVELVSIKYDTIDLYENGIRTASGHEKEFDVIIFALGFDAGTGALSEMDVRGSQGVVLGDAWAKGVETFAGVLVPNFPNMFTVCGPHIPFGNMPIILEIQVNWIGKTIRHMEENKLAKIEIDKSVVDAWSSHLDEAFRATLFAESAKASGAWFVGANIPGKVSAPLFYFGGVPTWTSWLENEIKNGWSSMKFTPSAVTDTSLAEDESNQLGSDSFTTSTATEVSPVA